MVNNDTLNSVNNMTDIFSIIFVSLIITLSTIWITLLIGKLIAISYTGKVEIGWRLRITKINQMKKIALLLTTLIFGVLAALFHTAQEFEIFPTNVESDSNCSEEGNFIELTHLYDGLLHLSLLMTISFANITTIFFQKLYSASKDFRLVKILVIFNILTKLPFLLMVGLFEFSYIWVEMFVIMCTFIEYFWLIRSEVSLYRTIKDKIHDLENSSLRAQTNWQEKKSTNRKIYLSILISFSFLLVSLPINWARIYIDIATNKCSDDDLPFQHHISKLGTFRISQVSDILTIIIKILFIPLLFMVVGLIFLTIYELTKKLKDRFQLKKMRENSTLIEGLIQN